MMRLMRRRVPAALAAQCTLLLWMAACPAANAAVDVPASVLQAEQQRASVIAKATLAAVSVFAPDGKGGGSGVVVTPDGFALTNFHVVAPVGDYMKCGMSDGRIYDAVIVSIDPTGDLAMIKLFGREDFPVAELGDSDQVRVGDWCFALGNPFLLATDLQPSASYGIVSGIHRYQYPSGTILEYTDCIQTDAAINPGNSGGPLFNMRGQLIGINGRCSFEKRGRVNVGVGYSISINQIKRFWGHLQSGRVLDHATLGATIVHDSDGTLRVSNILESSDAYRRGLRYGDELLAFGGRNLGSVNEYKNVLGTYPKGWRVPLTIRRDGDRKELLVRLAGAHRPEELLAGLQPQTPEHEIPEKKPERKPGEEEPAPRPAPSPDSPGEVKVPEALAQYIQPRPGFANRYFNDLHRQRIWKKQVAHGDFSADRGNWTVQGNLEAGGAFSITLGDEASSAIFPTGQVTVTQQQDLGEQLKPEGSGGVLAALHLWRRMLVSGPERFGEVSYLGTLPLRDPASPLDVLVGTFNVTESQFYFSPQSGELAGLEMFPDTNVDPCEITFSDYRPISPGKELPFRMVVRHGDYLFADLRVEKIEFAIAPNGS